MKNVIIIGTGAFARGRFKSGGTLGAARDVAATSAGRRA